MQHLQLAVLLLVRIGKLNVFGHSRLHIPTTQRVALAVLYRSPQDRAIRFVWDKRNICAKFRLGNSFLSADVHHAARWLQKSWLANVVPLLFVRHHALDRRRQVCIAAAAAQHAI